MLALIAALVFAGIMFAAGVGLGDHLARDDSAAEVVTASATTSRETGSSAAGKAVFTAAGKAVFASAGCGDCHAFDAAGSTAEVGPDLDEGTPDAARVFAIVRDGEGLMPSFEGELTERQIRDVAAFVSTSARR